MPFFQHGDQHVEAIQLERMNLAGRPMFSAALPPWFIDATAKHHLEVGVIYWMNGQTFVRGDDGLAEVNRGDWIARSSGGGLSVYDESFDELFVEIARRDPVEM